MATITNTIDTLYEWVLTCTEVCFVRITRLYEQRTYATEETQVEVHEKVEEEAETTAPKTFKSVREVLSTHVKSIEITEAKTAFADHTQVLLYKNPTIEFDGHIAHIPYGDTVEVKEARGRFYLVTWKGIEGWVLRDNFGIAKESVIPQFHIQEAYGVDHPKTARVRAILGDPFGLGHSEFPLQAGEYVLYRLWEKGEHIEWPPTRPRMPGTWKTILRGVPRVHIGVLPKQNAIMEYILDEIGYLAFVERVDDDGTILLSEANYPDSGIYSERTLSDDEWKALKPVFISVGQ